MMRMPSDSEVPPGVPPRPSRLPEHVSWPTQVRVYPSNHPATLAKAMRSAVNLDWVREDFGELHASMLSACQREFCGDWWILAIVCACVEYGGTEDADAHRAVEELNRFLEAFPFPLHLEGMNLMQSCLARVKLNRVFLEGAMIVDGDLAHAEIVSLGSKGMRLTTCNLDQSFLKGAFAGCDLRECSLRGARLEGVDMTDVVAHACVLDSALLFKARLDRSMWLDCSFRSARMFGASMVEADVRESQFDQAQLGQIDLSRADVRWASGMLYSANRIRDLRSLGAARDPWPVLRRRYTGPWFFIHAILIVAFVVPYVAKVIALSAADHASRLLARAQELPVVGALASVERVPAWKVLVGADESWWVPVLGGVLLIYNAIRGTLTIWVSQLRDAEDRSGITPTLMEYMGRSDPSPRTTVQLLRGTLRWIVWCAARCVSLARRRCGWPELQLPSRTQMEPVGLWHWHMVLQVLWFAAMASFVWHAIHWVVVTTVPTIRV